MARGYELSADELVQKDRKNMWHHLTQHKVFESVEPTIIVEGKGCYIKDVRGREFLDGLSGGVWCVNVGYGQESIAEAVYEQLKIMPYYALSAGNPPAIQLADKLTTLIPDASKVFISNSGSEANEKAFKMSRQYFRLKYPEKDKYKIIYRHRDYHGTTIGALSATGQEERRMGFGPLVPGFVGIPAAYCYRCHFGKSYPGCNMECARALEDVIQKEGADSVAAFIVEPITAGGGILVPQKEYFDIVQEICKKYEVLLIMDEVVCGFGRTGKWFGHQHFNVSPDMTTMAKGMASSYMPISATVCKQHLYDQFLNDPKDTFAYFRDISTYGGSAGASAAALANIKLIEEQNMLEKVVTMGGYLFDRLGELADMPVVGEIRGKGLFAGIELVEDKNTKTPVSEAYMGKVLGNVASQGVLVGRTNRSIPGFNNTVTLAPMYIVTKDEIDRMVGAIKKALETVEL
ncbi:aspartate aminotransferase family protein [Desulforamulus aeronauticus]|uniref:Taurine-pyruvate aminotransferase n=1 Tax=Desulforamulus aeronauticus DSM 10349 TaxID=1121421 RepID=A0A1M6U1T7_9FIRM|nr:aminotransferase [Desulforamulus aeronauticus]SHK63156.1 taurine-pyruvate aminotransferase [Desulforamulus aeronauticus DSM 10349]SHL05312.1 taurine-pyruvate aminotransferase [Desulforamulus aeronauticus DSM 10349]